MHIENELFIGDLPKQCIEDCSAPGVANDEAVEYWRKELSFTVDAEAARACLKKYGAWDEDELADKNEDELAEIVLWLACGDFFEWDGTKDSSCGSDIFCLGD